MVLYAFTHNQQNPHQKGKLHVSKYLLLNICMQLPSIFAVKCSPEDFRYEYTNCDEDGQRWRVAVPKTDGLKCEDGIPPPERGLNCSLICDSGMYLDISTQRCKFCPKGTYSLGNGVRFDTFDEIPPNFEVNNFNIAPERYAASAKQSFIACPPRKGWITRSNELIYVPSPCLSKLSCSVDLIRPGYVEYVYRLPRNSHALVFSVDVKDERCRSYRDEMRHLQGNGLRKGSSEDGGEWRRDRIELKKGHNVISWTVLNYRSDTFYDSDVITISHIDIFGLHQARKCSSCPGGTYSGVGAKECSSCPAGHFSSPGSAECIRCPSSQYSGARSTFCKNKPVCSQNDYYPILKPCINGKTRTVYVKVQPNICRDDLSGAVKIPESSSEILCPKCNPGMHLNQSGQCVFCMKGYYSQGEECHRCPVDTLPNYGYQYIVWNTIPPNMFTKCEYIVEGDSMPCSIGNSWIPSGNMIQSSPTQEKGVALELGIQIRDGFFNPLHAFDEPTSSNNAIAHIAFDFETKCADDSCALYFIEDAPSQSFYRLIADFSGTQRYQSYFFPIVSSSPTQYLFVFVRSHSSTKEDVLTDRAIIYRINITNVGEQSGGASTCLKCPKSNGKCVQCLAGEYISETDNECKKCPDGLVLNSSSDRMGLKSCVACGANLISPDSIRCISNGFPVLHNVVTNKTHYFNFTYFFNRTFTAEGVKIFAREGTSYFHSYNVSLLTENGADCRELYISPEYKLASSDNRVSVQDMETVRGHICRSTALPVHSAGNTTQNLFYISPIVIGDKILAIKAEKELNEHVKLSDRLDIDGSNTSSESPDIHVFFGSSAPPTQLCPHGVHSVVTLKCDPRQVKLPESCPDGTCDGCLYSIIVHSLYACPVCTEQDYNVIKGECIGGVQMVHSIPASYCISTDMQGKKERKERCTTITFRLKLLIFLIILTFIALCIIIVLVWRKNKSLEYKYMKLVEWKDNAKDLRALAVESCGVEDGDVEDEEDQDRIFFARKKRSYRGYKNERSFEKQDKDSRQPFVPLEEAD